MDSAPQKSLDVTQARRRVAPSEATPAVARPTKKPSVYHRVVKVLEVFQEVGSALDGRTVDEGPSIFVTAAREAGSIEASLCLQGGRYVVDFRLNVKPVTEEELAHTSQTGINPTSMKAFNALFDLMRLRDKMPTFAADETQQVVVALESCFGVLPVKYPAAGL